MTTGAPTLFVVTSGLDIGSPMAAALAARGARVAWLGDAPAGEAGPGVTRIAAGFASRAEVEAAFAAAVECVGAPTQVVVSALPPEALEAADIATLPEA